MFLLTAQSPIRTAPEVGNASPASILSAEHDMFSARTTVGDMLTFYHSQFPDFQLEKAHNLLFSACPGCLWTALLSSASLKDSFPLIGYVLFPAESLFNRT
jgi:hypothetical protein